MKTPIQRVRGQAKLTMYRVAKDLGLDRSHYLRIERGNTNPRPALAFKMITYWKEKGYELKVEEIFFPKGKPIKIIVRRKAKQPRKKAA